MQYYGGDPLVGVGMFNCIVVYLPSGQVFRFEVTGKSVLAHF